MEGATDGYQVQLVGRPMSIGLGDLSLVAIALVLLWAKVKGWG